MNKIYQFKDAPVVLSMLPHTVWSLVLHRFEFFFVSRNLPQSLWLFIFSLNYADFFQNFLILCGFPCSAKKNTQLRGVNMLAFLVIGKRFCDLL